MIVGCIDNMIMIILGIFEWKERSVTIRRIMIDARRKRIIVITEGQNYLTFTFINGPEQQWCKPNIKRKSRESII